MDIQIKLGRLFGLNASLQLSWLLIPLLLLFSLADHLQKVQATWSPRAVWIVAALTSLLFFACLVLHEYARTLVAALHSRPVRALRLFTRSGAIAMEKDTASARTALRAGVAGLLACLLLALFCLAQAWLTGWKFLTEPTQPVQALLVWLGYANLAAAVFNLLPVLGLDGGRMLHAVLWQHTNERRATIMISWLGALLALLSISYGMVRFFDGFTQQSLWLIFLGWFLLANSVSSNSYLPKGMKAEMRKIFVEDVMATEPPIVESLVCLQDFVDDYLLRTGRRCFIVLEKGEVVGLITPQEVRAVERAQWREVTVGKVMRRQRQFRQVAPDTSLAEAMEIMGSNDVNQLPVVKDGQLAGIISREHILRWLLLRAELNF